MINIYDFISSNASLFDQLKFGDGGDIFIDYLCPIQDRKARAWSHKNCLMYVVQGVKGYNVRDHYHQSGEHQVLFIRKGGVVLHQFFEKPYRALIFMFDDSAIRQIILEYPAVVRSDGEDLANYDNHPAISELKSNPHIQNIFISALQYLRNPAPESTISLEIKFKELIVNVLRDKNGNSFARYLSWICHEKEAAFIQLMRQNLDDNFTVKELARIACMSLSTFKRKFQRIFGMSPGKWLSEQRIQRSVYLLNHSDKPISTIAFDLGYNDTSAFSTWFKRQTGLSPAEHKRLASSVKND